MSCYNDLIEIREVCGSTVPTSGLFLNDLGLNLDDLNAIVERDYDNGEALGRDKIQFAGKVIQNLILQSYAKSIKTKTIIDSQRLGIVQENLKIDAGISGSYKGVEVEICNTRSFIDLFISEISLQANFDGATEIKVFDLKQGREIDSFNVTAVNGERVDVQLSKTYLSDRRHAHLFIGYDSSAGDSIQHYVKDGGCKTCELGSGTFINKFMRVRGGSMETTATPIKSSIKGSQFTGGISLIYSIRCNHEGWICSNKNILALPILYKAGALIAEYALGSSRQNSETLLERETWEQRLEKWEFQYRESLDNVVGNIALPTDDHCFQCNNPIKYNISLP